MRRAGSRRAPPLTWRGKNRELRPGTWSVGSSVRQRTQTPALHGTSPASGNGRHHRPPASGEHLEPARGNSERSCVGDGRVFRDSVVGRETSAPSGAWKSSVHGARTAKASRQASPADIRSRGSKHPRGCESSRGWRVDSLDAAAARSVRYRDCRRLLRRCLPLARVDQRPRTVGPLRWVVTSPDPALRRGKRLSWSKRVRKSARRGSDAKR